MTDCLRKSACLTLQNARRCLTNQPICYSLWLTENTKANCAECGNTPHSSDPTLIKPVTGLLRIIDQRRTFVLCGCLSFAEVSGPTNCASSSGDTVWLGRFAVPVPGRA